MFIYLVISEGVNFTRSLKPTHTPLLCINPGSDFEQQKYIHEIYYVYAMHETPSSS